MPCALRRGGTPSRTVLVSACTSTSSGRCPSSVGTTAEPATPVRRSVRNRRLASGTPRSPSPAISNTPSSLVGPKRCFTARSRRSEWCRSPSKLSTVSTTCSSTRGPASPPSLVTWPTSTTGTPRRLASPTRRCAHSRTCTTLPGADGTSGSAMVWMLSTTTRWGCTWSMAATMWGSEVSGSSHRCGCTACSRSARRRTCWALSSALTYSVRVGHWASSCSRMVLLPMPGSPPSRVTEPGTRPPPSTRSSSGMPVGCGWANCASTSPMGTARPPTAAEPHARRRRRPLDVFHQLFHASHEPHRPAHFGVAVPHSVQRYTSFTLSCRRTVRRRV